MNQDSVSTRRAALRQTSVRVLRMLVIVAAAVFAYFSLGTLEKAKSTYEGERSAPLVIVDKGSTANDQENAADKKKTIIELPANEVKAMLPQTMQPYIGKIEHQNFKNPNELVDRLNEEIIAKGDADKKKLQDEIDNLNKSSITEFSTYLSGVIEAQKNRVNAETLKGLLGSRDPQNLKAALLQKQAMALMQRHEALQTLYETAQKDRQTKIGQVDDKVNNELKVVYTDFKPGLLALVNRKKSEAQNDSSFRSVLNDKNGSHVIYQTIWLACVVVLVFGVLYVILMLLRPLPPFAGGPEALSEQAKTFLSRRGGGGEGGGSSTPEFARTIAVTAAALGIGTAVVVAGGVAGRKPAQGLSVDYSDSEVQAPTSRLNNRNLVANNRSGTDSSSEAPTNIINLPPVESPPSFNFVTVPKADETRINELSTAINRLNDPETGIQAQLTAKASELDRKISDVDSYVGGVKVPELRDKVITPLQTDVGTLQKNVGSLQTTAEKFESEFLTKLNSASMTIEDIRGDSLERFRRPEGRNIFTRFKQLFAGEKYVVSNQSYMALDNLMSYRVSVPCKDNPKATCIERRYRDLNAESILKTLAGLIGMQPVDESTFLGSFNKAALKPWKTVILRYTRVPY